MQVHQKKEKLPNPPRGTLEEPDNRQMSSYLENIEDAISKNKTTSTANANPVLQTA